MDADKLYWPSLLGTALLVRFIVVFWVLGNMPQYVDAAAYAHDASVVYEAWPGPAPYYLPPGLPYLLAAAYALFGETLLTARLFAIAVSIAGVGLVALLAHEVVRTRWAAQAAGWIAAFYPPDVMTSGQVYAQPLEMVCLLAMSYALIAGYRKQRWGFFAAAGLAFGVGTLTRPSLIALTPLLVAAFLVLLRRLPGTGIPRWFADGSLAFCTSLVLCVAPVMHINAAHGAGPRLSTNNAWHFFLGNNRYTPLYKTSYLSSVPEERMDPEIHAYLYRHGPRGDPENTIAYSSMALG